MATAAAADNKATAVRDRIPGRMGSALNKTHRTPGRAVLILHGSRAILTGNISKAARKGSGSKVAPRGTGSKAVLKLSLIHI